MENKMFFIRRWRALALAGLIGAGAVLPAGTALAAGPGEGSGAAVSAGGRGRRRHNYNHRRRQHRGCICSQSQCLEEGERYISDAGRHAY